MVAACGNCGKFGEMKPGKPFVCGVCGFYHDTDAVNERISAAKIATERKEAAERAARCEAEKESRYRRVREPVVDPLPEPYPRTSEPYRIPKPIEKKAGGGMDRSFSCLGGCLSGIIKILFCVFLAGVVIGACLSYKSSKKSELPKETISPPSSPMPAPNPPNVPTPIPPVITPPKPVGSDGVGSGGEVWIPGKRHPRQPKVYATSTPGQWALEPGYEFVNPGTSDWRVRRIPVYVRCPSCNGVGAIYRKQRNRLVPQSCRRCRGTKVIRK